MKYKAKTGFYTAMWVFRNKDLLGFTIEDIESNYPSTSYGGIYKEEESYQD